MPQGRRNGARRNGVPEGRGKTAIIQSGGGAKGAYSLGVMRAILAGASPSTRHEPIAPDIYTGTSVGAYNAVIMASQPEVSPLDTLAYLERIWRERIANTRGGCGNGVFRLRGLPIQELELSCFTQPVSSAVQFGIDSVYLANQAMIRLARFVGSDLPLPGRLLESPDISAFFDPEPLRELMWSTVDLGGLERSGEQAAVACSNWQTGKVRVFWKEEIVAKRLVDAVLASTAIPGVFPPVVIEGESFVDGGILMNTPLRPAIRAGADVLHVIYLDPIDAVWQLPLYPSTFEVLAHVSSILNAAQIRNDIRIAEAINRGLALLRGMERRTRGGDSGQMLQDLGNTEEILRAMRIQPRRMVTIHRYLPPGLLASGSDVLNFGIDHIDLMIEQGYRDAVQHDCEKAECIFTTGRADARPEAELRDLPAADRRDWPEPDRWERPARDDDGRPGPSPPPPPRDDDDGDIWPLRAARRRERTRAR